MNANEDCYRNRCASLLYSLADRRAQYILEFFGTYSHNISTVYKPLQYIFGLTLSHITL